MKALLKIGFALTLMLGLSVGANAQSILKPYQKGPRLIDGSQLNLMVGQVNGLTGNVTGNIGKITTNKLISSGTAPTLSSCGTSPSVSGNSVAGEVTMGTGTPTGCVITFATAYTNAPYCIVTWQATPLASQSYAISATAITLTQTATSSNKVNYMCVAQSGG